MPLADIADRVFRVASCEKLVQLPVGLNVVSHVPRRRGPRCRDDEHVNDDDALTVAKPEEDAADFNRQALTALRSDRVQRG